MASATGIDTGSDQLRHRAGLAEKQANALAATHHNVIEPEDAKTGKATTSLASNQGTFYEIERILGPIIFTALALFTRLYRIGASNIVTWDEAHFGKFGSYYLKREYYFDVHPPLGKMLVGLSGYLAGYNGSFGFESGHTYPEDLDYTTMRVFNAMFNVFCVPLAYFTAKELKLNTATVWLVTSMILFENTYVTLGRFILLDSMLVCFTFTTVYGLSRFHNLQREPFSRQWWTTLLLTGISIGCVTSVKMVGLFATALVGVYTVADLWIKLGDTKMPYKTYFMHWVARIIGFIILPTLVFMAAFKAHFIILTKSGPGDSNMSSLFQANLEGTNIVGGPQDLAYGSRFTLKNQGYNGGLLHSHVQTYPEGSEQQQITTYHHKDANNEWRVETPRDREAYNANTSDVELLKHGDTIRFIHLNTGRNLHSHQIPAPLTKGDHEVSCYGNLTIGDNKDHWIVEIYDNFGPGDNKVVHPLTTTVRFKHEVLGCYLSGKGNHLPPWGFKQGEVTCSNKVGKKDKSTHWNFEQHWNERMPDADNTKPPKTSFMRDFVQLNVAMMASNNALVPDPDKHDELASEAWMWPLNWVGLRLCGWTSTIIKYYLLGNPVNMWGTTFSLFVFAAMTLVYLIRWQRQIPDFSDAQIEKYMVSGIIPALGWFFHYLPFIIMGRVKYVHHYLPAFYFATLVFGFVVDHFTSRAPASVRWGVNILFISAVTGMFVLFSPISFGMEGEPGAFSYLNWLKGWKI